MKKIFYLSLCCITVTYLIGQSEISVSSELDPAEIISAASPDESIAAPPALNEEVAPVIKAPNDCQLSPQTIIEILAAIQDQGSILNLLQQNLYLRTNPLIVRSLLDLPSLQPYYIDFCGYYLGVNLFYNQTTRGFFTDNNPFVSSYIELENSRLADELELILEDIKKAGLANINLDVHMALSLFKNIRIQERRVGGMFGAYTQTPDYTFRLQVPLLYHEHNFFLNETEQDEIKTAPFFLDDPNNVAPGSRQEVEQFFRQNLVNDRYGIGDTRLVALFPFHSSEKCNAQIGFQATLPTSFDFRVGIFGSAFSPYKSPPCFRLEDIINNFQCNRTDLANDLVIEFGKAALRRLSTLLLNVPLGNGRFFGMGPQLQIKNFWSDYVTLHSEATIEFFAPRTKPRFFLNGKNPADFKRDLNDTSQAVQNLAFINQQFVNTFFPLVLDVEVTPGALFKAKQALYFDNGRCSMGVGLDFWYQAAERLGLKHPAYFNLTPENFCKGINDAAYQLKVFNHISYFGYGRSLDWQLGFAYDATVLSSGIGKDYTLGIRLGFIF